MENPRRFRRQMRRFPPTPQLNTSESVRGRAARCLPLAVATPRVMIAQTTGTSPVRVDTKGLAPKMKFEHVIAG
jgi:hypothetical protein